MSFPEDLYRTLRPGFQTTQNGMIYVSPGNIAFSVLKKIDEKIIELFNNKTIDLQKLTKHPSKAPISIKLKFFTYKAWINPKVLEFYKRALNFLEEKVLKDPNTFFNQSIDKIQKDFLQTHELILEYDPSSAGKFRENPMFIPNQTKCRESEEGILLQEVKTHPAPEILLKEICELLLTLGQKILKSEIEVVKAAAQIHQEIVKNRLFKKGNGRVARIWMNVLLQTGEIEAIAFTYREAYKHAVKHGHLEDLIYRMIPLSKQIFDS